MLAKRWAAKQRCDRAKWTRFHADLVMFDYPLQRGKCEQARRAKFAKFDRLCKGGAA